MDRFHTFLFNLHHVESQIYLLCKERVSAVVDATLLRMERTREQKYSAASGEQPSPQNQHNQQAKAISKITIQIMDSQLGRINWSLWSEKNCKAKD